MAEQKVENVEDYMKYYCRVCTANTRTKQSKPEECIGIFKKSGLKSFLEKYLQLQISEDDPLPKVICKVCFDKIEAIEFMRVIARRTESLLKDFLKNQVNQPKSRFQNEYNSFALATSNPSNKPEEVVVNVSLSDPLTKDINKKLLGARKKKESFENAFKPAFLNRHAVTSSPVGVPVTIVHQMPRKKITTAANAEEKKKLQMALNNATTVTLENPPQVTVPLPMKLPVRPKVKTTSQQTPLRHISEAPSIQQKVEIHPVMVKNAHPLSSAVTLGCIIKDEDLLRLILKALKWPFNSQTLDIQIQRLKNTKFSDVIVDPNLLQDADLIQILGPLINPALIPVPQPQTYHITVPPEQMSIPSSTISYKLPAETSVQIITVPPEEKTPPVKPVHKPRTSHHRPVIRKRPRFPHIPPTQSDAVIVLSDDSDDERQKPKAAFEPPSDDIQRFEVQLDPAMYPGVGENSNSNETMLATLNRQREAMMRMHRSKRKQSLLGVNVEMVDDIMIVDEGVQMNEPYPEVVLVKKPRKAPSMSSTTPMAPVSTPNILKSAPAASEPKSSVSVPSSSQVFTKLPTLPPKKLPTLPPEMRKPTNPPNVLHLPAKKPTSAQLKKPRIESLKKTPMVLEKRATLADADSTTKIIVKESKVPKSTATSSSDIEDQIIKVRIGKQVQKAVTPQDENEAKKNDSSSDEEVMIVVEYEDEEEEGQKKEPESKTENDNKETQEVDAALPEVRGTSHEDIVASPKVVEEKTEVPAAGAQESSKDIEIPAIEIKEEEPELDTVKEIKEEEPTKADEKEDDTDGPKRSRRNFVASKTSHADPNKHTRATQKRKVPEKKPEPPAAASTSRPARKSKTLSKYYKGPPAAGPAGRSMRSRT